MNPPPRRPRYLVIALVTLWIVGINVAASGYTDIQILTDPWFSELQAPKAVVDAQMAAMRDHYQALLPLNIGRLMLGGLLVGLSAVAIFSGRLSLSVSLQTIGIMTVLTLGTYVTERPVREARINAQVIENEELLREQVGDGDVDLHQLIWTAERLRVMIQVAALLLSGFALTRPKVRHFYAYQAAARANQER